MIEKAGIGVAAQYRSCKCDFCAWVGSYPTSVIVAAESEIMAHAQSCGFAGRWFDCLEDAHLGHCELLAMIDANGVESVGSEATAPPHVGEPVCSCDACAWLFSYPPDVIGEAIQAYVEMPLPVGHGMTDEEGYRDVESLLAMVDAERSKLS